MSTGVSGRCRGGQAVLLAGVLMLFPPLRTGPGAVLGRWEGTSTCVRTAGNQACRDEIVRYDFVRRDADSSHVLLHAYKLVSDTFVTMGDLDLTWKPQPERWEGEFANTRAHIRWSFRIGGDTLYGVLVGLPGQDTTRHAIATRAADH